MKEMNETFNERYIDAVDTKRIAYIKRHSGFIVTVCVKGVERNSKYMVRAQNIL